jgi:hypothetical protein
VSWGREGGPRTNIRRNTQTDISINRAQEAIIVFHSITFTMYIHEQAHTQTHIDIIKCTHLPIPVLTNIRTYQYPYVSISVLTTIRTYQCTCPCSVGEIDSGDDEDDIEVVAEEEVLVENDSVRFLKAMRIETAKGTYVRAVEMRKGRRDD